MKAAEIRETSVDKPSDVALFLREIAAQLAQLNETIEWAAQEVCSEIRRLSH